MIIKTSITTELTVFFIILLSQSNQVFCPFLYIVVFFLRKNEGILYTYIHIHRYIYILILITMIYIAVSFPTLRLILSFSLWFTFFILM